ncbi:hypothetical protein GCM10023311_21990 [Flaviramulus aquimarinus]|uniref:Outer membrane protein beta-barrel domain-containing protein n=2 Tax=Flaviramulus aquimarinus TaxID=1170456 RepID=A0ABP9FBG0_9FLAO
MSSNVTNQEVTVKPGTYKFSMTHVDVSKQYKISAIKENMVINQLETPEGYQALRVLANPNITREIGTFDVLKGEQLSITIEVFNITRPGGVRTETKVSTFKYIYKTKPRGKWQTTFGFNFIHLGNNNTFFSKSVDSIYVITEGTNQNKYDFHPTLMFTWLKNNNDEFNVGFSGGLGYDLEKSLSVFLGGSLIYNQNITLTLGIAFHNQKKLNSNYEEGDIIKENLTFEQLHGDFIRINPFISLSFRLDKNPFK